MKLEDLYAAKGPEIETLNIAFSPETWGRLKRLSAHTGIPVRRMVRQIVEHNVSLLIHEMRNAPR